MVFKKLEMFANNELGIYEMNYESNGAESIVASHVKPLANRNTVTGAQVIIDDITEKTAGRGKKAQEERFRLMLEGIPAGLACFKGTPYSGAE